MIFGTNYKSQSVHYPDFTNIKIQAYWNQMLSNFYADTQFSGLYFFDNEVTDYTELGDAHTP